MARIVIDARKMQSTTGRVVEELIKQLEQFDHTNEYKIAVLKKEQHYYKPTNPNFEVVVADFNHYSFAEQLGFARFLYGLKPDMVHFHMPQQPLLYFGRAITTVHDLNLLRVTQNDMSWLELIVKKAIFRLLLWLVAKRAHHIITPTQFTKDDLVAFAKISPRKVTVTHLGMIQVGKPVAVPKFKNKRFITYLGRAEPYKNNRRLIEAHQRLLADWPDLHLVIVGQIDDLRKADMQWVREQGYKNVDFTGWMSDEQAAWLYQRTEAFVQPSLMEGFGLPVLEAMQQGAPVASTNATCSPEVYGDAAHYFNPHSTNDITRAIQDILTNKKLRAELVKKGHAQVKKYSWQRMSKKVYAIYQRALGQTD